MTAFIDYTGQYIGTYFVKGRADSKNTLYNHTWWITECTNCKMVSNRTNIKSYLTCIHCRGKPKCYAGMTYLFNTYRRNSVKNNREFSLTLEQFQVITSIPCHYCGVKPSQVSGCNTSRGKKGWGDYLYNGIDRKDNQIGYVYDNCLPCCGDCNYAKGSKSYTEFNTWLNQIVNFRQMVVNKN